MKHCVELRIQIREIQFKLHQIRGFVFCVFLEEIRGLLLFDGLLGGDQLETATADSVCGLLAEEELFYFPRLLLLTTLLLLSALHLIIHARECLLICLAFIVKLSEFVFDSIEVDMGGKNKLVLFIQLLIDLF